MDGAVRFLMASSLNGQLGMGRSRAGTMVTYVAVGKRDDLPQGVQVGRLQRRHGKQDLAFTPYRTRRRDGQCDDGCSVTLNGDGRSRRSDVSGGRAACGDRDCGLQRRRDTRTSR